MVKKKLFFFLFLCIGIIANASNKKMIIPVPSYSPPPLIKNGYIQIDTLKKEEPGIYKILIVYEKCTKKPVLNKRLTAKSFNRILNSNEFNHIWLLYIYNKCKQHSNDKVCQIILKQKPPKPLKCTN